jgi:hypothetical protein
MRYEALSNLTGSTPKGERHEVKGGVVFDGADFHADDLASFVKRGAVEAYQPEAAADASADLDFPPAGTELGDAPPAPPSAPEPPPPAEKPKGKPQK